MNTRNIVNLEKALGCNPVMIFGNGDDIPNISTMVTILHESLQQLNHGIKLDDTFNIFDDWVADGNNMVEFVKVILEIYKVSGLVPNNTDEEEKN